MNLFKAFIFEHDINLKLLFFLKSKAQINLLCDRKYEYEVEKNRKVLASILDTIVTLEDDLV